MNSDGSGSVPAAGCCEHGNEILDAINWDISSTA
jgi:hypothetical protein